MLQEITDQTRLVIVTVNDPEFRVRNIVRFETGSAEWPQGGRVATDLAIWSLSGGSFEAAKNEARLLTVLLESKHCHVLVDGLVETRSPACWKALKELALVEENTLLPPRFDFSCDRQFLHKRVASSVKLLGLRRIDRLRAVLELERGEADVVAVLNSWKQQFDRLEASHICDWIVASLHLVDSGQMFQTISESSSCQRNACLLSHSGSDLVLKRFLERTHPRPIPTLTDLLKDGTSSGPITIVLDSIQGGGQLLTALRTHRGQLVGRGQRVQILPCHATDHGIDTVKSELETDLADLLEFNTQHSFRTENQRGESAIPIPELKIRLELLGCKQGIIIDTLQFAIEIGRQLTEQNRNLGHIEPLGRRNLGLTTILAGCPGQGVLPLLWLGSIPGKPVKRIFQGKTREVDWKPLFPHHHDQMPTRLDFA